MSHTGLYLIGTVHSDLDGEKRLNHLLDIISPSVIALEFDDVRDKLFSFDKSSVDLTIEFNDFLDNLDISLTSKQQKNFLDMYVFSYRNHAFELKSSKKYVQNNSFSKLEYIDLPIVSEKNVSLNFNPMVDLINSTIDNPGFKDAFLNYLDGGFSTHVDSITKETILTYYRSKKLLNDSSFKLDYLNNFSNLDLKSETHNFFDSVFSSKRDLFMSKRIKELYSKTETLVAIVGTYHLMGLRSELNDLNPVIISLDDYLMFDV